FEGARPGTPLNDYYHPAKEALRRQVNECIRHAGALDAVIYFDAALRYPEQPSRLAARYVSGDHLHLIDEGNRGIAVSVDLDVL
ncbi:SGNH/GDSL hydrolase family protein, partial [Pseudomonas aeruginosa]